jgi:lipopolysaccharide transport system permease protein
MLQQCIHHPGKRIKLMYADDTEQNLLQESIAMQSLTYHFDLVFHLVWREFVLRYKRSTLGILWSLMMPLTQLIVLIFLFQRIVPLNIENYPAFVFSALLPWTWFSSSVSSACGLFTNNRDLLRRPNFKPVLLMVVNALSHLLTYLMALPVLFTLLFLYRNSVAPTVLLLPVLILIQGVLIVGVSIIVATLNVFYRDVQHIVTVVLSLLFYLTPVFYRPQAISAQYSTIYTINPLAILIQDYRAILLHGTTPAIAPLLLVITCALLVCGVGYRIYYRKLHLIFDEI